jgi:glutamyl-Q tRNA(Asp) synthetase
MPEPEPYVGRFAPSPTGPLHFGSLLAAIASYLQAKIAGGQWLLRIEDIDPPREQAGADLEIIRALEAYGFEWDGPVSYQSRNTAYHESLVTELLRHSAAYPCACSRRDLATAPHGPLGAIYPGTCRAGCDKKEVAIRVRTNHDPVCFDDGLQGQQSQDIEAVSGDFVIKRRDGLIAYQLAVVADDDAQGITEIVRGIDLLDSTPRQIHLQRLLGLDTPHYLHIPIVENQDGQKLSKLTGAPPLPTDDVRPILIAGLQALGQAAPAALRASAPQEIWQWAAEHWQVAVMSGQTTIAAAFDPLAAAQNGLR